MTNKGLATKSTPNQPSAMEAQFAHLEALVTSMASSMASQVKPTTHESCDFSTQGFNLGLFYGARFSRPLSLNEIESYIFNDHILGATSDKNLVRVSAIALIIRANVRVQEPQGVNEKLNLQRGEAQHQVRLP